MHNHVVQQSVTMVTEYVNYERAYNSMSQTNNVSPVQHLLREKLYNNIIIMHTCASKFTLPGNVENTTILYNIYYL